MQFYGGSTAPAFGALGPVGVGADVPLTCLVTSDGTATGTTTNTTAWHGTFALYRTRESPTAAYSSAFTAGSTDGRLTGTIPAATTATLSDAAYVLRATRTDSGTNTVVAEDTITFVG